MNINELVCVYLKIMSLFQNYEVVSTQETPAALKQNGSPVSMRLDDRCIS